MRAEGKIREGYGVGKQPKPGPKGSSRDQLAAQRAAQQKADKRRNLIVGGGSVLGVVIVIAILVAVGLHSSGKKAQQGGLASTQLVAQTTDVPATTVEQIGQGAITANAFPSAQAAGTAAITKDGKPYVLFVGAEYCPFCASDRWSIVNALSRFGTFSNLGTTFSSPTDTAPNTATYTFHGSTYTSDYLTFDAPELQTNTGAPLDKLTADQEALFSKYDPNGSFPFLLIGNKYVSIGALYSPTLLAGKTQEQIGATLSDPKSPIAQNIVGGGNVLTAAICQITDNKPEAVCSSPMIKSIQAELDAQH